MINMIRRYIYPIYLLPASSCIPEQNTKSCVNVISEGSPILIRSVRRISFGITMRPRSSMRLTIPPVLFLVRLADFNSIITQEVDFFSIAKAFLNPRLSRGFSLPTKPRLYQQTGLFVSFILHPILSYARGPAYPLPPPPHRAEDHV